MRDVETEQAIRSIVRNGVEAYASGFSDRHIGELDDPDGVINMKIHNVFISALGGTIQYYTALVRSLDSSLGNMLEKMALNIADLFFDVKRHVEGELYTEQVNVIAKLLNKYKDSKNNFEPDLAHYDLIRNATSSADRAHKKHESDYYLVDKKTGAHHLIELKIGGDLDNKKARAEKEAIFEQYAILSNALGSDADIRCHFATAYNRYGEGKPWSQGRVLQFFSKDELLIGRDFWDFICCSDNGYDIILDEYRSCAGLIKNALEEIRGVYLNED